MTKTLTLRSVDIPNINKFGIGFESMFDELMRLTAHQNSVTYPPYNVVKIDENNFEVELAVAGFGRGEIEIQTEKNILSIRGNKMSPEREYVYKGISDRAFTREFTLAEHVEVVGAQFDNGILTVALRRLLPEKLAPKTIDIQYR